MLIHAEWLPLLALGIGSFLVYIVARIVTRRNAVLAVCTSLVYAVALFLMLRMALRPGIWDVATLPPAIFEEALWIEPGAVLISLVSLALGLLVTIYSGRYLALDHRYEFYYPLLLLISAGIVGMVLAIDLFTLYLFTALTSATAYVLVAFRRRTMTSIEAGFKYAIMGGMATVVLLAGIGYYYRETGQLAIAWAGGPHGTWIAVGIGLMLFAYAVKAAVVPAHTWLPDAYGRAPSSVAVLSGMVVEASIYVLLKLGLRLGWPPRQLGWMLLGLGLANMTLGNLMGLMQVYGKRLLGYSSIAQVGYMLLALGVGLVFELPAAIAAGMFLVVVHGIMKALAFLCKGACHFYCDVTRLEQLDGVVHRMPAVTLCFAVALAGLAGIPPLAGFFAKWQVFASLLARPNLATLIATIVLAANILLGLGYYLPMIARFFRPLAGQPRVHVSPWMLAPIIVLTLAMAVLVIYPQPLFELTERTAHVVISWGVPR
jgi:proton-translocating NADH-quinone oxidoreductase chain N